MKKWPFWSSVATALASMREGLVSTTTFRWGDGMGTVPYMQSVYVSTTKFLQEPLILYHCIGHIPALWSISCNSEQWGIDMHWWQGLTGWLCSGSNGDLGPLFFVSAKLTQHVGVDKKKRGWKMLEAVSGSNVPSGSKWFRSTPPEQFSNLIMGFRQFSTCRLLRSRVDSADSNNPICPGPMYKTEKKKKQIRLDKPKVDWLLVGSRCITMLKSTAEKYSRFLVESLWFSWFCIIYQETSRIWQWNHIHFFC